VIATGVNVVELPATTGFVVWVGTVTVNAWTASVGEAVAVVTEIEQLLFEYSVAVIVKVPPTAPAFSEAFEKLAALLTTFTQLLVGAAKLAPDGRPDADSAT
jgi:hypothetical protein